MNNQDQFNEELFMSRYYTVRTAGEDVYGLLKEVASRFSVAHYNSYQMTTTFVPLPGQEDDFRTWFRQAFPEHPLAQRDSEYEIGRLNNEIARLKSKLEMPSERGAEAARAEQEGTVSTMVR